MVTMAPKKCYTSFPLRRGELIVVPEDLRCSDGSVFQFLILCTCVIMGQQMLTLLKLVLTMCLKICPSKSWGMLITNMKDYI